MILIEFGNERFTINDDYELTPKNEMLSSQLSQIIDSYDSPALGFKTSYIATKLKENGFEVLDVYDKELEDAPEGAVY